MSTHPSALHPRVALHPPEHVPDYIKAVRAMASGIQQHASDFPGSAPLLTQLTANLDALEQAETAVKTGTHGTAADRDTKLHAVKDSVTPLLAIVQQRINQSPDQAETIVAWAALHLHKTTAHGPQQFGASEGAVSGSVKVSAPSSGGGAHTFQYSLDGGATWGEPQVSDLAHVTFSGLPIGKTAVFRHRLTLHGVTGDWSQPVSFVVR